MTTSTRCAVLLLAAALAGTAGAGPDAPEAQLQLQVGLADGSQIIGTPFVGVVPLRTSSGTTNVGWKEILTITMDGNRETAMFAMLNGDTLKGIVELDPLKLQTILGKVAIGLEHVKEFGPELCEIAVTPSLSVSAERLTPGSARLSGGYTPSFDAVARSLAGAQFLRVPWQATPAYTVTVVKPGLLYQIQSPGDLHTTSGLTWQKADSELSGAYLAERFRTLAESGTSFKCSGYELSFIARKITIRSH